MGVGGPADVLCRPPDVASVVAALDTIRHQGVPWRVIGRGSNLIVDDAGVDGWVLDLRALRGVRIDADAGTVVAGAGLSTATLLGETKRLGLGGLECVVGYPATVGGAVRMNAGGRWGCIGERVASVLVADAAGDLRELDAAACRFGYRTSALADVVIVEVRLRLPRVDVDAYRTAVDDIRKAKTRAQPLDRPTAGCTFKNPSRPGPGAGQLIDTCGLLGERRGDAAVSTRHGNFIENLGRASSDDVLGLADDVRETVARVHGIDLELEVEVWRRGDDRATGSA